MIKIRKSNNSVLVFHLYKQIFESIFYKIRQPSCSLMSHTARLAGSCCPFLDAEKGIVAVKIKTLFSAFSKELPNCNKNLILYEWFKEITRLSFLYETAVLKVD